MPYELFSRKDLAKTTSHVILKNPKDEEECANPCVCFRYWVARSMTYNGEVKLEPRARSS